MRVRLASLCAFGLILLASIAQEATAQELDIRDFVRQQFFEGVSWQEASQYSASDVPVLLEMLADPAEEAHWTNIVGVLGIIGDESVVQPLIDFAAAPAEGTLSSEHYSAKSSVMVALGYSANKGSDEALDYLVQSLDPEQWGQRGFAWESPFHATTAERDAQLTTMVIIGLALSGREEAGAALAAFQEDTTRGGALRPMMDPVLAEALETNALIADEGLAAYYRQPPP